MIQRIQTLYYAVSMILLSILLTGTEFFQFVNDKKSVGVSVYGLLTHETENGKSVVVDEVRFPLYLSVIGLILFIFIVLMGYKNLKRQFQLARSVFFIYLAFVVGIVIFAVFGADWLNVNEGKRELGLGFLLFILGFPFCFLAQLGIKRDKNLIDSLDRLR